MKIKSENLLNSKIWDVGIIILAVLVVIKLVIVLPTRSNKNDFAHYYVSSRLLIEGRNPYLASLKYSYEKYNFHFDENLPNATNPPLLLIIFIPLTFLPPQTDYLTWVSIQIVSLIIILKLTYLLVQFRMTSREFRLLCAGIISSAAVYWHFVYSQVQLPLAALILAAFWLMVSGKKILAIFPAIFAALIKLYPFYFIPWFVWHGGKNAIQRLKLAFLCIALTLLVVGITGIDLWQQFYQTTPMVFQKWIEDHARNYTFPSLLINLMIYAKMLPQRPEIVKWVWTSAMILGYTIFSIAYIICWRTRHLDYLRMRENEFALLCIAMLAGSLIAWGHYMVFLIFPFALAITRAIERPSILSIGALVMSWLTLNHMKIWDSAYLNNHLTFKVIVNYLPLFGIICLGAFFVYQLKIKPNY